MKRRRRIVKKNKTKSRTITLYDKDFTLLEKEQMELSDFVRWLIINKQEEYLKNNNERDYKGDSIQTTVSLYPSELDLIDEKISNGFFSNFIRWGLDNYITIYKNEYIQKL